MIRRVVRTLDERTGTAPLLRENLRYLFPDHWSFLLGEVALYAFVVLVGTGVYLALFFEPSTARSVYHGPYAPLRGLEMTDAYRSTVHLSLEVKAGLLMRQTHHWAADVFVASIVVHLLRVFFTGAFRKPREITYFVGLAMLGLALLEGFLGYSLVDDLLSGMGLAIAYSVAMSIPLIGANLSALVWGGPFPGDPDFWSRMYVGHVFLLPMAIAALIGVHLFLVSSLHHTQFRGRRQTEQRLVGVPLVPGQAPRSLALFCTVAGVLFLLGGLVQINPIWLWGPYELAQATNGAQPDWYLGWLIGALRLVPSFDVVIDGYTVIPNPFWGGALFPLVVFAFLAMWPFAERRRTRDRALHNLLDRPRDAPWRTAIGMAVLTWVLFIFIAGAADRAYVLFGISYRRQIEVFRVLVWVVPLLVLLLTRRVCLELQRIEIVEEVREAAEEEARSAAGSRPQGEAAPP